MQKIDIKSLIEKYTIKNDIHQEEVIKPSLEKVAYKLYSKLLDDTLWIVTDKDHMQELRSQGITEPIYTYHDITVLKQKPKDEVRTVLPSIHKIKGVFPTSAIEDVEKEPGQGLKN